MRTYPPLSDISRRAIAAGITPGMKDPNPADATVLEQLIKVADDCGVPVFEFFARENEETNAEGMTRNLKSFSTARGVKTHHLVLGVGTVLSVWEAKQWIDEGAQFLMGPTFKPEVCELCKAAGIPYYPVVENFAQLEAAWTAGAQIIKVDLLDRNPNYLARLHGALPWSKLMQNPAINRPWNFDLFGSWISIEDRQELKTWIEAGLSGVATSKLFTGPDASDDLVAEGKWNLVRKRV